jgi:ribosomal protein L34
MKINFWQQSTRWKGRKTLYESISFLCRVIHILGTVQISFHKKRIRSWGFLVRIVLPQTRTIEFCRRESERASLLCIYYVDRCEITNYTTDFKIKSCFYIFSFSCSSSPKVPRINHYYFIAATALLPTNLGSMTKRSWYRWISPLL